MANIKYTTEQVIQMLKDGCNEAGSLRKMATKMELSAAYLSDVIGQRQEPGPKICAYLKLKRVRESSTYYVEEI